MAPDELDGRIGEGWGGEGASGVHVNLVIGRRGSPTAAAAASALANPAPGHVPFLVCAGAGTLIRPATVFVNKTSLTSDALSAVTWGAAQLGVADAVLDEVERGALPEHGLDDLVLLAVVWLGEGAASLAGDEAGETALRAAARTAMGDAIRSAATSTDADAVRELVARRGAITNGYYRGT